MARIRRLATAALIAAALVGCTSGALPAGTVQLPAPEAGETWRAVASAEDAARIDAIAARWQAALAAARRRAASRIDAEGAVLEPAAALPRAALPPGSYRCRILRLEGGRFTAYNPFFCHVGVEGALESFTKQTGTDRPGGYLWPDGDTRRIFLGAMALGADEAPPAYGDDPARDLAGVVERIGPFRWRMALPRGVDGLDVIEIVPAAPSID